MNPLGDGIDQLVLLPVVLVEEEVQLIERRPRHLPVVLLVEITQRDRVGQQLVQVLYTFFARVLRQRDRHPNKMAIGLSLVGLLMRQGRRSLQDGFRVDRYVRHMLASRFTNHGLHLTSQVTAHYAGAAFRRFAEPPLRSSCWR